MTIRISQSRSPLNSSHEPPAFHTIVFHLLDRFADQQTWPYSQGSGTFWDPRKSLLLSAVLWMFLLPQNSRVETWTPSDGVRWRWGLWEEIGAGGQGQTPWWYQDIVTETLEHCLTPPAVWGHRERTVVCGPGNRASPGMESKSISVLDLQPPEL